MDIESLNRNYISTDELDVMTQSDIDNGRLRKENFDLQNQLTETKQKLEDVQNEISKNMGKTRAAEIFKELETDKRIDREKEESARLRRDLIIKDQTITKIQQEVSKVRENYQHLEDEFKNDSKLQETMHKVKAADARLDKNENVLRKQRIEHEKLRKEKFEIENDVQQLTSAYNDKFREWESLNLQYQETLKEFSRLHAQMSGFKKKEEHKVSKKSFFRRG